MQDDELVDQVPVGPQGSLVDGPDRRFVHVDGFPQKILRSSPRRHEPHTCTNGGMGSATNATLNLGSLSGRVHTPAVPSDLIGAIPSDTSIDNNGVTLACDGSTTDQIGHPRPIEAGDPCNAGAVEATLMFQDGFGSGTTSAWSSATR